MAFELRVRSVGGALWVQLPDRAAQQLGVGDGDVLHLTEALHGGFRITPSPGAGAGFLEQLKAADSVIRRYPATLRELAR